MCAHVTTNESVPIESKVCAVSETQFSSRYEQYETKTSYYSARAQSVGKTRGLCCCHNGIVAYMMRMSVNDRELLSLLSCEKASVRMGRHSNLRRRQASRGFTREALMLQAILDLLGAAEIP